MKVIEIKVVEKIFLYYIIIVSVVNMKDVEVMVGEFKVKGYIGVKVLMGDGKICVSIMLCVDCEDVNC